MLPIQAIKFSQKCRGLARLTQTGQPNFIRTEVERARLMRGVALGWHDMTYNGLRYDTSMVSYRVKHPNSLAHLGRPAFPHIKQEEYTTYVSRGIKGTLNAYPGHRDPLQFKDFSRSYYSLAGHVCLSTVSIRPPSGLPLEYGSRTEQGHRYDQDLLNM